MFGEVLADLPTVTCPTADMNAAGSCPITAYGAAAPAGGNYNDVVYVNGTLTVTSATFAITFNANGGSVLPAKIKTLNVAKYND